MTTATISPVGGVGQTRGSGTVIPQGSSDEGTQNATHDISPGSNQTYRLTPEEINSLSQQRLRLRRAVELRILGQERQNAILSAAKYFTDLNLQCVLDELKAINLTLSEALRKQEPGSFEEAVDFCTNPVEVKRLVLAASRVAIQCFATTSADAKGFCYKSPSTDKAINLSELELDSAIEQAFGDLDVFQKQFNDLKGQVLGNLARK